MSYKYFTDDEVKGLAQELCIKLDQARAIAGVPFVITSGLRSCSANTSAMGVEGSAHLSGKAVDLACTDSRERFLMIRGLFAAGFTRIGLYSRHLHCDTDETKDSEVTWWGGESH